MVASLYQGAEVQYVLALDRIDSASKSSLLEALDADHLLATACCHKEMHGLLQEDGKGSWSLCVCQNNACPRSVWDRNTFAAINILALFLHRVQGKGRLQAFRRNKAVDEADVMNVEAVAVE